MPIEIKEVKIKAGHSPEPASEIVSTEILIEGKAIDATSQLVSVETSSTLNQPGNAILVLADVGINNFPAANSSDFELGKKVKISAGHGSGTRALFTGIISRRSLKTDNGQPQLIINCQSEPIPARAFNPATPADLELTWGADILNMQADQDETGISGSVSFQGNALTVGRNIKLKGLANFVNGVKHVEAVRHVIKEGQWTTTADFSDN